MDAKATHASKLSYLQNAVSAVDSSAVCQVNVVP